MGKLTRAFFCSRNTVCQWLQGLVCKKYAKKKRTDEQNVQEICEICNKNTECAKKRGKQLKSMPKICGNFKLCRTRNSEGRLRGHRTGSLGRTLGRAATGRCHGSLPDPFSAGPQLRSAGAFLSPSPHRSGPVRPQAAGAQCSGP